MQSLIHSDADHVVQLVVGYAISEIFGRENHLVMFGHLCAAEHVKLTLVLSLSITALIIRCVAVGTPEGYSLYSLNSTDVLDPVYKSGEF